MFWMCLIFSASTRLGAPDNTSYFLRPLMTWLFPHMSKETFDLVHHIVRKMAHFTEYAILGFLAWRVLHFDPAFGVWSPQRHLWFALLFCMLYASTDEFHQIFVPGREPAVKDVMLDSCGSAFGLLTIWIWRKSRLPA